jgi:molybdate transport system ATP-binding protein
VSLEAGVRTRVGKLELDASFSAGPNELVVLLGPNGAGKTTLLRALAGLVPLRGGRVVLDGKVLEEPGAHRRVPPEHRCVGFVFQEHVLFPNMSVIDNVAFGLRARGRSRAEAHARATKWLERFELHEHAHARPGNLSGGQRQRVALARALIVEPSLLLLDEPFAALDASARPAARRDVRAQLGEFDGARMLVTHDPVEAMAMADRVIVLEEGRVLQSGTPREIVRHPRSNYVADVAGLNLFRGFGDGHSVRIDGSTLVTAEPVRGEVFAVVHPHAVALHLNWPEGTPRNVWRGLVQTMEVLGERVRVQLAGDLPLVAEVTPGAVADLRLEPGVEVWASIKATEIRVYPA